MPGYAWLSIEPTNGENIPGAADLLGALRTPGPCRRGRDALEGVMRAIGCDALDRALELWRAGWSLGPVDGRRGRVGWCPGPILPLRPQVSLRHR